MILEVLLHASVVPGTTCHQTRTRTRSRPSTGSSRRPQACCQTAESRPGSCAWPVHANIQTRYGIRVIRWLVSLVLWLVKEERGARRETQDAGAGSKHRHEHQPRPSPARPTDPDAPHQRCCHRHPSPSRTSPGPRRCQRSCQLGCWRPRSTSHPAGRRPPLQRDAVRGSRSVVRGGGGVGGGELRMAPDGCGDNEVESHSVAHCPPSHLPYFWPSSTMTFLS